jgi:hypothetical protein
MTKTWRYAVLAAVAAVSLAMLTTTALAQRAHGSEPGRYQLFNGTPGLTQNIMLLDTATGQAWVTCSGDEGRVWCSMPRTTHVSAGTARSDP